MVSVQLEGVSVQLDRSPILHDITTTLPDGAFGAVIGPSGSGKSTVLRVVAGLLEPSQGRVWFGSVDVTETAPGMRDIGMVFQSPALFSNRNVRRNVSFPLELRRETVESIRQRVDAETRAMHLEHLVLRHPDELSRGEQQLVQIARTMVRAPRVLLLDEPFAPLDAHLRQQLRAEIKLLQEGYGVTTLMATNDPQDVAALASHVIVLGPAVVDDERAGLGSVGPHTVVQSGPPAAVADDPTSLDVAAAVGPLWTFDCTVAADTEGFWLGPGGTRAIRAWSPSLSSHVGARVVVGCRPGALVVDERGVLPATITRIVPGSSEPILCNVGGASVYAGSGRRGVASLAVGRQVSLAIGAYFVFDRRTGRRLV